MTTTDNSTATDHELDSYAAEAKYADRLARNVTDPAAISIVAALDMVHRARRRDLELIAASSIAAHARMMVRAANRDTERDAEQTQPTPQKSYAEKRWPQEDLYLGKYRHGITSKDYGAVPKGCTCECFTQVRQEEAEFDRRRAERISDIITDHAHHIAMQWTAELLAASFAVDQTGTTVRWGAATIDEHSRRVSMLTANAGGNIDAAARHQRAIDDLSAGGASTLDELAGATNNPA